MDLILKYLSFKNNENEKSYILLLLIIAQTIYAQVAIGKSTVNSSAALDVISTINKGVLLPRVDIVDILSNTSP